MVRSLPVLVLLSLLWSPQDVLAQLVINEASSRNAHTLADATGEHHDWVELFNAGSQPIDLGGHALSDDPLAPAQWVFPSRTLAPGAHLLVHCSGEDRRPYQGMQHVLQANNFIPVAGWNTHVLTDPIVWDGSSNLLISSCGLRGNMGGLLNAVFHQTTTAFLSSATALCHDPSRTCGMAHGDLSHRRPVMRINGQTIGTSDWLNAFVQLPAPYANWQGGAKQSFLIHADELLTAGVVPGPITSLGFQVVDTHGAQLQQLDFHMALTTDVELSAVFRPTTDSEELHTNFKLGRNGETVYLFDAMGTRLDSLYVMQPAPDHSNGRSQDGGNDDLLFPTPTPGTSNSAVPSFTDLAMAPIIGSSPMVSATPLTVTVYDLNPAPSELRYTLNGTEPTTASSLYTGPITLNTSAVLKVRAFTPGLAPSTIVAASYLIGVQHTTAVLSVVTPQNGLYGPEGIFTNWQRDDEVQAHVDFFRQNGELLVSQYAAMQVDGGLGGSRGFPQHSFRLEFDNGALGDGTVNAMLIPDRPARHRYSRIYLRNGSNQFQILPHKDAVQVKMMAAGTNSYYAAWTPVSVYINGAYFGLYELREKYDDEYFRTLEGADAGTVDLLSVSAWNGSVLRPTEGEVDPFWQDMSAFQLFDPTQADFWDLTDARFDLTWYTDYIIGQQWMGTRDWPFNNIKIQRSDVTSYKWRFATIDLELAMAPNGQSDHLFNALEWTANTTTDIPYTYIWQRAILNPRFHDHFINRFADVMNSAYLNERILGIAQDAFELTRPEMGKQFARWSSSDTTQALVQFEANHEAFLEDLSLRTPVVREHIRDHFNLPREVDVTLNVVPAGAGTIRISTLHPDTYPWEGVYFDGVPIRVEAVPNTGYIFSHWTADAVITDALAAAFLDTLAANTALFEANFQPDLPTLLHEHRTPMLTVAPNPTHHTLTLDTRFFPEGAVLSYSVVDPRGRLVEEGRLTGQPRSSLVVAGLATGPYQVQVTDDLGNRAVARFVKW
ncbi:MAG: CotH kinase family protein [Flavobacteriales bacterium]|nr:CotH kinase family protein [Flavobacteriales bacterium]